MLANSNGQAILDGLAGPASFQGPPAIFVGDSLTDPSEARWLQIIAWAEDVGRPLGRVAPVVGLDLGTEVADASVLALLDFALLRLGRCFDVAASILPYRWSDGRSYVSERPCGPILSVPNGDGILRSLTLQACWTLSGRYVRLAGCNGQWGIGTMAVGSGNPEIRATPPVYDIPAADRGRILANLLQVWQRGGPVSLEAYAAIQAKEATRFGISRRFHPALVPYCLLDSPI